LILSDKNEVVNFRALIYNPKHMTNLACPRCLGDLVKKNNGLYCARCQSVYSADKILDFSSSARSDWEQLTPEQYEELFADYRRLSWREALERIFLKYWDQYLVDYNTSPERSVFIDEVLGKEIDLAGKDVLEIGCSFGNMSRKLAARSRSLVAVDTPRKVIEWLNLVKEKERINNLSAIRIDNLDFSSLPFKDGSFDVVVLGMTLQWIGTSESGESPDVLQRRVLADINRVLKKDGRLCFFDKNRYSYNYFLDEPDPSTLKYASLMPRWLADLYVKLLAPIKRRDKKHFRYVKEVTLAGARYRNYRHSLPQIRKMIAGAGFADLKSFIPLPGVRFQKLFIPLADERAGELLFAKWFSKFRQAIKGHPVVKMFFWVMLKMKLARYLADGYLIIAKKG